MKRTLIYILILINVGCCNAQNVSGFYVNGFNTILGNTIREDSVLLFAQNNGFNYLTLYDVHIVNNLTPLTNTTTAQAFANFINKAKTQYSINEVGVAAENFWFFKNIIHIYNQQHSNPNQKVDVYNLEFEFWIPSSTISGSYYCSNYLQPNAYSCDTSGAFKFYKNELRQIDSLANANGKKSEAYFGFFNNGQAKQIVQTGVDRVLLSIYITSANYSQTYQYGYIKPRLQALATASVNVNVIPLYSSEPSFMQTWVSANSFFTPYTNLNSSLTSETGTWKNYIQLDGIQWFAYSFLPKKNLTTSITDINNNKNIFSIYPNPADAIINVKLENSSELPVTISISNISDNTVLTETIYSNNYTIDTKNLNSGIYFITIRSKSQKSTQKIIIE